MLFKSYYLELWQPFCLAERNHLCNFGRGHYGKHSCEIILNLDQWLKEMLFKENIYGWMDRQDEDNSSP